ncbi:hypothetical protein TSA1_24195 [Bradyrhizobium nitroreducens]|uniref:Uncharacterized protein n=1 Tax=Bradyrhizobium nitroreducens TaxID=709803 RepID=A0A2M6UFY9_9BRAD|nr:hypothetical protein TSA1_24195 [Bradyrhizobium nitroreducens]
MSAYASSSHCVVKCFTIAMRSDDAASVDEIALMALRRMHALSACDGAGARFCNGTIRTEGPPVLRTDLSRK